MSPSRSDYMMGRWKLKTHTQICLGVLECEWGDSDLRSPQGEWQRGLRRAVWEGWTGRRKRKQSGSSMMIIKEAVLIRIRVTHLHKNKERPVVTWSDIIFILWVWCIWLHSHRALETQIGRSTLHDLCQKCTPNIRKCLINYLRYGSWITETLVTTALVKSRLKPVASHRCYDLGYKGQERTSVAEGVNSPPKQLFCRLNFNIALKLLYKYNSH